MADERFRGPRERRAERERRAIDERISRIESLIDKGLLSPSEAHFVVGKVRLHYEIVMRPKVWLQGLVLPTLFLFQLLPFAAAYVLLSRVFEIPPESRLSLSALAVVVAISLYINFANMMSGASLLPAWIMPSHTPWSPPTEKNWFVLQKRRAFAVGAVRLTATGAIVFALILAAFNWRSHPNTWIAVYIATLLASIIVWATFSASLRAFQFTLRVYGVSSLHYGPNLAGYILVEIVYLAVVTSQFSVLSRPLLPWETAYLVMLFEQASDYFMNELPARVPLGSNLHYSVREVSGRLAEAMNKHGLRVALSQSPQTIRLVAESLASGAVAAANESWSDLLYSDPQSSRERSLRKLLKRGWAPMILAIGAIALPLLPALKANADSLRVSLFIAAAVALVGGTGESTTINSTVRQWLGR